MNDSPLSYYQFPEIEAGEEDLCRALWISVIVQAFVDAKGNGSRGRDQLIRSQALKWLSDESSQSDFAEVCDLANLCFRRTQKQILALLKSQTETLDFRCLTKAWGKSQGAESRSRYFHRSRRNALNRVATQLAIAPCNQAPHSLLQSAFSATG